ncbi:DUF7673 family protein [Methylomonas sp. MgM2]
MSTQYLGEIRLKSNPSKNISAIAQNFEQLKNQYAEFSAYVNAPIDPNIQRIIPALDEHVAKLLFEAFRLSESVSDLLHKIRPTTEPDPVERFLQQIAETEVEREELLTTGLPALTRLVAVAQRDTGQAVTVRRFLLALYNGRSWPFNLTSLRGLDCNLFDDCMAVLKLDSLVTAKEVHEYIKGGDQLFAEWCIEFGSEAKRGGRS